MYKIVNAVSKKKFGTNSRKLKRAIKLGKEPEGRYDFFSKLGKHVFSVEYKVVKGKNSTSSFRVEGEQITLNPKPKKDKETK